MKPYPDIIDTHVHLWDPRRMDYAWHADFPVLNRPYLPADYREATKGLPITKMLFMECNREPRDYREEVLWVDGQLKRDDPRIVGIIACVPLDKGADAKEDLQWLARNPMVKAVRRIYQTEAVDFCLNEQFLNGMALLPEFGFPFDLCIYHPQLPATVEMVRRNPGVQFVLDHLGKPDIKSHEIKAWQANITALAKLPNSNCKLSGILTEADHQHWKQADLEPYLRHVVQSFGPDRLIFGGDWPVVNLAGSYVRWVEALDAVLSDCCSAADRENIYSKNAGRIYRL
jgi:L-fuconolactonase